MNIKIKNNFYYSERMLGYESDNHIIYDAGPIKISISGVTEKITMSTSLKWKYLLPQIIEVAKLAWEVEDNQISINDTNVEILYNFNNLKLYIEHNIIFG